MHQLNKISTFNTRILLNILGANKLLEIKNQKWDFNGCMLRIISETQDTITLRPFNPTHLKQDIEIDVVVEHDAKTNGRL